MGPIQEIGSDSDGLSLLNPRLSTLDLHSAEQSENVYENKGPVQKSTTPAPPYPRREPAGSPSSDEEGLGSATLRPSRSLRLGVKPVFAFGE